MSTPEAPYRLVTTRRERHAWPDKHILFDVLDCGHEMRSNFVQFVPGADRSAKHSGGQTWRKCGECRVEAS